MGLVRTFQITQPFGELTVAENVLVGAMRPCPKLAQARQKATEILNFVGLASQSRVQAGSLTIADRKRLELARALATQPKLLLLDEIMAGLRPTEVDAAIELIYKIRDMGVTVVVVEHLMHAVLALSERLYVLHHGSLIAEGKPEEVIHRPEVVDAYFGEPLGTTEVDRLEVAYGQVTAVWDVSLTVEPGELVAVVGPNGAGKTTLINAM